jgi:site-specific DNA recombinase
MSTRPSVPSLPPNAARVNVLSYGCRYITKHTGGCTASYKVVPKQAAMARQLFEWVGRDRPSIGEVCWRLKGQARPFEVGQRVRCGSRTR